MEQTKNNRKTQKQTLHNYNQIPNLSSNLFVLLLNDNNTPEAISDSATSEKILIMAVNF